MTWNTRSRTRKYTHVCRACFLMAHNTRMCVVCLFLDVGHHDNQRQVMKWERMHCDQCSTPKLVK